MSFSMPPVKCKPEAPITSIKNHKEYEVADTMLNGLANTQACVDVPHPLMLSEANYSKHRNNLDMTILRNTQGLHAPLRIGMEIKAAKKVGRLPFLTSSNIMFNTLKGRDIDIGPEDIFNQPEFSEVMGQPHAMVERSLGLL
ncbi:proteasome maturation protein [Harmonia axyridis]|uniref:proteasome maturation protein n=1 Tax=Harmonia axyridis TaxID=115357 RepID=UPI001E276D6D|nr:proteasome maturation protein [Harmonia axyridis]